MWSVYIFICFLCFKSHSAYPQSDLERLGSQTSKHVKRQAVPMDNKGTEIKAEVDTALLSSDAKAIMNDMTNGIGGTTVATYDGKTPRTFIFKNRTRSFCKGTINGSECDGTVEPFNITNREDYCYATSHAAINSDICLSSRSVRLTFKGSNFVCESGDNTPTLTVTRQEYEDLCRDVTSRQVVYKYYVNASDPMAVPIPNSNPFVKCLNNEPGVCEFKEDKTIPGTFVTPKGTDSNNSNKGDTVSSKKDNTSADKNGNNTNGSNTLLQHVETVFLVLSIRLLFQY